MNELSIKSHALDDVIPWYLNSYEKYAEVSSVEYNIAFYKETVK